MHKQILNRLRASSKPKLIIGVSGALLLCLELASILLQSIRKAGLFDGYPANGIFQLLDPLRRLYDGQVFGRDFQYFHGPITALVHYPLFLLFGHNLYAASLVEWLISPLLILILVFFFVRSIFPKKLYVQLLGSWLLYAITQHWLPYITLPVNSALAVRISIPIAITLVFLKRKKWDYKWHGLVPFWDLILPILLGLSLLAGTEYGLAAFVACLAVCFLTSDKNFWKRCFYTGRLLVVSLVALIIFATIISKGAPLALLRYSFIDIPSDQFWYFGAPPNFFVTRAIDYVRNPYMIFNLSVGFSLLGSIFFIYLKKRWLSPVQASPGLYLMLWGFLSLSSTIGYYFPYYQGQPLRFAMLLTGAWLISLVPFNVARGFVYKRMPIIKKHSLKIVYVFLTLVVLGVAYRVIGRSRTDYGHYQNYRQAIKTAPVISGTHLNEEWQNNYKTYLKGTQGITGSDDYWSLYTGLLEADKGVFNPSGYDYIIHALGPRRRAEYIQKFDSVQPESVITLRQPYFLYQTWLENETWSFFERLFTNYKPAASNTSTIVWRKKDAPWQVPQDQWSNQQVPVKPQDKLVIIPLPSDSKPLDYRLYTLKVTYSTDYSLAKLPFIRKTPRLIVRSTAINGWIPISLPPYAKSFTFPVLVRGDEKTASFSFETFTIAGHNQISVHALQWRRVETDMSSITAEYALHSCSYFSALPDALRAEDPVLAARCPKNNPMSGEFEDF